MITVPVSCILPLWDTSSLRAGLIAAVHLSPAPFEIIVSGQDSLSPVVDIIVREFKKGIKFVPSKSRDAAVQQASSKTVLILSSRVILPRDTLGEAYRSLRYLASTGRESWSVAASHAWYIGHKAAESFTPRDFADAGPRIIHHPFASPYDQIRAPSAEWAISGVTCTTLDLWMLKKEDYFNPYATVSGDYVRPETVQYAYLPMKLEPRLAPDAAHSSPDIIRRLIKFGASR
jgi:hypothetical protein